MSALEVALPLPRPRRVVIAVPPPARAAIAALRAEPLMFWRGHWRRLSQLTDAAPERFPGCTLHGLLRRGLVVIDGRRGTRRTVARLSAYGRLVADRLAQGAPVAFVRGSTEVVVPYTEWRPL